MIRFFSKDAQNFRPSAIRAFAKWINDPSVISFAGGSPNPQTFPAEEFAEIAGRVLRERGKFRCSTVPREACRGCANSSLRDAA